MEEKKKSWVKRGVVILIVIIAIIWIVTIGRKWIILNNLYQKTSTYNMETNYYKKIIHYSGTSVIIEDIYRKENQEFKKTAILQSNEKLQTYTDGIEKIDIQIRDTEKTATIQKIEEGKYTELVGNLLVSKNAFNRLWQSIQCTIKEEKCNGVSCYFIDFGENYKVWVDKENYLIVREANGSFIDANGEEYSSIRDVKYKIGTITDEDVKKPELTEEYIVREIK
ncbi:MAG: hypothetical protein ACLTEH_04140 [Clostridia bacterium]